MLPTTRRNPQNNKQTPLKSQKTGLPITPFYTYSLHFFIWYPFNYIGTPTLPTPCFLCCSFKNPTFWSCLLEANFRVEDKKKERAAKGKEVAELKGEQ